MSLKNLSDYTIYSRYAHYLPEKKRRETWDEITERVFAMHERKYKDSLDKDADFASDFAFAKLMVKKKKVLGSQRALQFGGKWIEKHAAKLYNCTFSHIDRPRVFQEIMYLLLCGCGVGFSVQKKHINQLPAIQERRKGEVDFTVEDSIEGWANAVGVLINSYYNSHNSEWSDFSGYKIRFDFSNIREEGALISEQFKAPGPKGLSSSLQKIETLMEEIIFNKNGNIEAIDYYDIIMHFSDAVLSGGVRRSATICLFSHDDEKMINAKTGDWFTKNPQRARSNNSVVLIRDKTSFKDFQKIMQSTKDFGEPGFFFSEDEDHGTNPCCEIGLFPKTKSGDSGFQFCNLCEINGRWCNTEEDFLQACRAATIIGTLQAGYTDFVYLTDQTKEICDVEALLGVSITGVMDNPDILLNPDIQNRAGEECRKTNTKISKIIGINPAARITCVKPAGCQKAATMVSTTDGILRLDELGDVNGDSEQEKSISIYTDFKGQEITTFFVNGKQKTKKITLDSGMGLEATLSHKYRTISEDGAYEWETVSNLKVGDVLPYSLGEYGGGSYQTLNKTNYTFNKYTPKYQMSRILQPGTLNEDVAWFLGIYFGDGSNHKGSIRISIDYNLQKGVPKLLEILKRVFGIKAVVNKDNRDGHNGGSVIVSSVELLDFLKSNGLLKEKSANVSIPQIIRRSPKSVIEAFLSGFAVADGCDKSPTLSYCTISKQLAEELVTVLRAIGRDCKLREMPPTESSYGSSMRYWVQERKSLGGNAIKITNYRRNYLKALSDNNLNSHFVDKVVSIEDSECLTYDLEVSNTHTYLANSYISHNSTSCVLQTASGIHPHHSRKYLRRVQANKNEFAVNHFKKINPLAVEESVWSSGKTDDVISFICEVPKGSILKNNLSALELLEKVKITQQNWVKSGHSAELCVDALAMHNVSNTITVKPDEWEEVTKYIYENKKYFTGVSLLSGFGDLDYNQAPFSTVLTPEEMVKEYGNGSMLGSGLVVDGLAGFENNLWVACETALGFGEQLKTLDEPLEPKKPRRKDSSTEKKFSSALLDYSISLNLYFQAVSEYKLNESKVDWVRRFKQFAERYFEEDLKKTSYCLKHLSLWHKWLELKRTYVDVDWSEVVEDQQEYVNADTLGAAACAGGKCEI